MQALLHTGLIFDLFLLNTPEELTESTNKLVLTEENTDYLPEQIYSELYPVGLHKATVKGLKKGNASLILAHVKKGEGLESATQIYLYRFFQNLKKKSCQSCNYKIKQQLYLKKIYHLEIEE